MPEDIQIEVLIPEQVFGSTLFTATIRVTNIGNDIAGLSVEPITLPGRLVRIAKEEDESAISELELTKKRLVREMEQQVQRAYDLGPTKNKAQAEHVGINLRGMIEFYAAMFSVFTISRTGGTIPTWASEALKIQDWCDVEKLEKDIIANIPQDSFLRKAFEINKDKLRRCLAEIQRKAGDSLELINLETGDTLAAGASMSYPFTIKAPHAIRVKPGDLQFQITYRKGEEAKVALRSVGRTFPILSSDFAVPTGSMLGAAAGYTVRICLQNQEGPEIPFKWAALGGSILLGLLFALFTARKADSKKMITVEDFVGGFLIGAVAGLFSEEVLKKLGGFFK